MGGGSSIRNNEADLGKKIGRRKFVIVSLFSGVSLLFGGWWLFKVRRGDSTDIIMAILKKRLGYLKTEQADLEKFAADFQGIISARRRYLGSWSGLLTPLYAVVDIFDITPYSRDFESFEEFTVTLFLLSSDFFEKGADLNRPVKYYGLYDPYETGCDNPFAEF
jgi:hypothetical protein